VNNKRRFGFHLLLFLTPFLLLVLLELLLRLFNFFPREPLFVDAVQEGREVIRINPDVARRYFDPKKVVVPNLYPESFGRTRTENTFRIFCLGGSTTAGFPFEFQVPFPAQLRILLSGQYPGRQFEVINLGLSAVNSFTVLDFIPEVLAQKPDLILLYMGHNEFYGAYGSASVVSAGRNGALIRAYLGLQRLRSVQMVRALISSLTPARRLDPENSTLMEQVAAGQRIPYRSALEKRTLENFRTNLELILEKCRRAGVPVVAGTLVSNLKDQPPLGSFSRGDSDHASEKTTVELTSRVDALYQQGAYQEALAAANQLIAGDSLSAGSWYHAGRIQLALGDSLAAMTSLKAARERDPIRFRAGEDFNRIIADVARTHGACLADIERIFASASPAGIPGAELICDHLHPNPEGYFLMAQGFTREIASAGLIKSPASVMAAPFGPFAVTDLDWEIGLLQIYKLIHRWPFADRKIDWSLYKPRGERAAARIAYDYLFNHHNWVQAHYAMADTFSGRGEHEKARREYEAVLAFYPDKPQPYLKIAAAFEAEEEWAGAEKAITAALARTEKKGMIYYRLALAQSRQKKLAAAIQNIQHAIVAPEISPEQRIAAKYDLAGFFVDAKRLDYAAEVLQDILREKPDYAPALELKQKYLHN